MKNYPEHSEDPSIVQEPDASLSYTADDYAQWTFEGLFELIRGKVFKMSPAPSSDHQRIQRVVSRIFFNFFNEGSVCEVFAAPFDVFLIKPGQDWTEAKNILQPDLCIICDPGKISQRGCIGPPDFVLEILSPATAKKDQREKFQLYEEYGVPEYWIVDPNNRSVTRNLMKNGKYEIQMPAFEGECISPQQFEELEVAIKDLFVGIKKREY